MRRLPIIRLDGSRYPPRDEDEIVEVDEYYEARVPYRRYYRRGFGRMDQSQRGWCSGGRGRNRVSECRYR